MSAAVTVEGIGTHAIIAGQRNVIDRLARRNGNGGMGHIVHLLPGRKNGAEISIGRRSRLYAQRLIILTVHQNIGGHDRSGGGNGDSHKDNLQSGTDGGEQISRERAGQAWERKGEGKGKRGYVRVETRGRG